MMIAFLDGLEVTMRRLTFFVVLALALSVAAAEAAKPSGTGKPKPTTTKAPTAKGQNTKGTSAKGAGSKTTTVNGGSAKGSSAKAKGVQTKADKHLAKSDTKAVKADAKVAKGERKTGKQTTDSVAKTTTDGARSTTSGKPTTSTRIDYTATSLGQKLQKNSVQRSKIEAKLKAAGYNGTVYEAAYGFKNFGQLNAATNQVQNQGMSFELLKVLMTGKYVDPKTHVLYQAQQMPDGTVKLVSPDRATNPVSTLSLGQSKQAIAGGAVMPEVVPVQTKTS